MQLPPLSVIAAWPKPNFENPETRGPANEIVAGVLTGIVTIILPIRLYTRHFLSSGLALDDALIVLAYVCVP